MKKYLQFKNEVNDLTDVSETIKATEKIAASQIHFLKKRVAELAAYNGAINATMARLLVFYRDAGAKNPLLAAGLSGRKALLVISSNKGLVGNLFHNLINSAVEKKEAYAHFSAIGSHGRNYLQEEGFVLDRSFEDFSDIPKAAEVEAVADYFFSQFLSGKISGVDIIYSEFISLGEQRPKIVSFLSFDFELGEIPAQSAGMNLPIFDSAQADIFDNILNRFIFSFFYKVVMEARLSEFSARTIAMEEASNKVMKVIKKARLDYFKERRKDMTQRQLEIFNVHKIL